MLLWVPKSTLTRQKRAFSTATAVTQQGVKVDKSRSNFLQFAMLSSESPDVTLYDLTDYAARNVLLSKIGEARWAKTNAATLSRPAPSG